MACSTEKCGGTTRSTIDDSSGIAPQFPAKVRAAATTSSSPGSTRKAAPANGVPNKLPNKFDPWTYAYPVKVAANTASLVIKPTAMSNKISSMKVNGTAVAQGSALTVAAAVGSVITVEVVSPDGSSTSSYKLTLVQA